jgi:hypothetical protein
MPRQNSFTFLAVVPGKYIDTYFREREGESFRLISTCTSQAVADQLRTSVGPLQVLAYVDGEDDRRIFCTTSVCQADPYPALSRTLQ